MSTEWRRRGSAPYRLIPELEEMRRRFEDIVRPLMRASPFRSSPELNDLRRKFEEDVIQPVTRAIYGHIPEEQRGWAPSIDAFEKEDNFEVKVELPGMKQEDINVSVSDNTLVIKGEKKQESNVKDEDYYRSEITYGSFYRSIALPSSVDTRNTAAVYEDGVLRITFQKTSGAKPKMVTVQVKKGAA